MRVRRVLYFAIFKTNNIHDQHIKDKICVTLGKYFSESHIITQNAYDDLCLERTLVCCERFERSKNPCYKQITKNVSRQR